MARQGKAIIPIEDPTNEGAEGKGIVFDPSKIKLVPIDDIDVNDWNPKDDETPEFNTVKEEIKKKGMRALIYVRHKEVVDGKQRYEVVDGEQRWTSCKQLNYQVVPVYDWEDMPIKEAQEMTLGFQVQVPFNEIKLAHLLKDMIERYADSVQVPYTPDQIKNYLDMANFDWSSYQGEMLELHADEKDVVDMEVNVDFLPQVRQFIIQNEPSDKGKKQHLVITGVTKYKVLVDAMKVIKQAVQVFQLANDVGDEGRALELIAAEYLSGVGEGNVIQGEEVEKEDSVEQELTDEYQH